MRGRVSLALEYSLPGDTVSQKNLPLSAMAEELMRLLSEYAQANLITSVSDAEYKLSKRGEEVYLGADKLKKRLDDFDGNIEVKIESIDKEKNPVVKKYVAMYTPEQIVSQAWRDVKKGKDVSMHGMTARVQTLLAKILPHGFVMSYWMNQQKLK